MLHADGPGTGVPVILLAWRNLWRAPGRSLTTAGVVALATFVGLLTFTLFWAVLNGIFQSSTAKTGHLVVRVKGYADKEALADKLFPARVVDRVRQALPGAEVEGVLSYPVLVAGERRARGALLLGIEPGKRNDRELIRRHLVGGTGLKEGGAVLGRALARRLQLGPGKAAYLFAPGALGQGSGLLPVTGLVELPEARMERNFLATDLATAQNLVAPGMLERVEVTLPGIRRYADREPIEKAQAVLAAALGPDYEVLRWDQVYPGMATLLSVSRRWLYLFVVLFFLLAGLMVLNTLYLSFYERIRELGIVAALGATPARLVQLVFLEATLMAVLGMAVGSALGLLTASWMSHGFPMIAAEEYAQFGIPKILYGELHLGDAVVTLAFALLTSWLAVLWPAYLAVRLEPVAAMQHTGI